MDIVVSGVSTSVKVHHLARLVCGMMLISAADSPETWCMILIMAKNVQNSMF